MKGLLTIVSAVLAAAGLGSAAPCTNGTLASYVALGAGGCTIGSNSLFGFEVLSGTAGATPIGTVDLAIAPFGTTASFGFTATTTQTAGAGTLLESIFTYKISGDSYTASSISLSGSSETGDGAVTDIQNYCAGGAFGPDGVTGCTAVTGALVTVDGAQQTDTALFAGVSLLSITDDFTLDGGLAGSATGGSFTDRFTAGAVSTIPEPFGFALTSLGLAIGILLRRRTNE
ncbi:MAG TPA: hypothetical protein VGK64_31500 [Bryobacteraceae bacterium]